MHAQAESLLLEQGSRQADGWGANYSPGKGRAECIEFTSLINLRPAQGNRSMAIEDAAFRALLLLSPATCSQMRFVLAAP